MQLEFRQGIVKYPNGFIIPNGSTVNLVVTPQTPVTVAFSDKDTNYLVTESLAVTSAWPGPFTPATDYWLYWDINVRTGALTRGHTTIEPFIGSTAPALPVDGQHWFDTANTTMFVWRATATRWARVIRTFAAKYNGSFTSLSVNSPLFDGTQVGNETNSPAGYIVYDSNGDAIKRSNDTFYNTETLTNTGSTTTSNVKLASIVLTAEAQEPIPAFRVVRFSAFGQIVTATSFDITQDVFGIIDSPVTTGDIATIYTEGVITNPLWDWSALPVGTMLYVAADGTLTPSALTEGSIIAYVLDANTIYFRPAVSELIAATGAAGRGITSVTRTTGTGIPGQTDTYTITYTDATTSTFSVYNGADGAVGLTGAVGNGIATVVRTTGTGAPGTTDTYTITFTDATTSTFSVYNGADGQGGEPTLSQTRLNRDLNGIYTTVEWDRDVGTLYRRSVLSGGTSPEYTTRTETLYGTDGTTVLSTTVFTLSYVNGEFVSEVITNV